MEKYHGNTVEYWKQNAEEDYIKTPLSVLKYITVLEEQAEQLRKHAVVGRSEQLKAFAEYLQERMWQDGEKDLSEFADDFLKSL